MKSTPILFSGPMVRAILDGRKTQTRRIYKHRNSCTGVSEPCPYGGPGDEIWVRETWKYCWKCGHTNYAADCNKPRQCRSCDASLGKWKPSIHMFKFCSRISLEILSVRPERLQDITHWDAKAEGVECLPNYTAAPVDDFRELWDSINGRGSWDSNPWVWRIEFKRKEA